MDKASLFGCLSAVHLRKHTHDILLPDVPALAMYVSFSNGNCWTDVCYQEVLSLGEAAGLHFSEYYLRTIDTYILRGTTPAHPIVVNSDTAEEDSFKTGESRPWSVSYNSQDEASSSEDSSPTSAGAAPESELSDGAGAVTTPAREPVHVT